MSDLRVRRIAAMALVIGALLGVAGTFAPSASSRGLAWGVDGTALVVAAALLAVHHIRRGNDLAAAGFLVFVAGEALILQSAAQAIDARRRCSRLNGDRQANSSALCDLGASKRFVVKGGIEFDHSGQYTGD